MHFQVADWLTIFGGFFFLMLAIQLVTQIVFEGLVYATGAALIWLPSFGRIRTGERRDLWKRPPMRDGGWVVYREGERWYIYQNFAGLIGLSFWICLLVAIFGHRIFTSSP